MEKKKEHPLDKLYRLNLELVKVCEEARLSMDNHGVLENWPEEMLEKRRIIKGWIEVHCIACDISYEVNRQCSNEAFASIQLEKQ